MKHDNRRTYNTTQHNTTHHTITLYKHYYTLNVIFILFLSPFTLVRLPKNLK